MQSYGWRYGGNGKNLTAGLTSFKLDTVAKALKISLENHHRAVDDAECTAHIFVKFIEMLKERHIETLNDLNSLGATSVDTVKSCRPTMRSS